MRRGRLTMSSRLTRLVTVQSSSGGPRAPAKLAFFLPEPKDESRALPGSDVIGVEERVRYLAA
jgi:hypothetical protein